MWAQETTSQYWTSRPWQINRIKVVKVTADAVESSGTSCASDNPELSELMQFQVAESLPGTNHRDICSQSLHAWNVISKSFHTFLRRFALELTSLPLLELGWAFARSGGTLGWSWRSQSCVVVTHFEVLGWLFPCEAPMLVSDCLSPTETWIPQ